MADSTTPPNLSIDDLDPRQREAVECICTAHVAIVTGGPGCHRKGQKLLRATGELVAVEDVRVGDLLAGMNGAKRRVLELRSGFGAMVRIVPTKGDPFVVNADHILTVIHSVSHEVTDVSVREYLTWTNKHHTQLFRQALSGGPLSPYEFRVEQLSEPEAFYGFTLDGDGRYLLDDFTVTHNTGKTSTLRAALDVLDVEWTSGASRGFADRPYALCAPTGKAAKRMEESTGRNASTIHRLLGYKPGLGFTYNRHNPLSCAVVIVDEASMLDVELGAALLRALSPHTRLILVGDVNQLPPVGPGQLFADLIASGQVPTVRLTTLHRSAAQAWISSSAPLVLEGKTPPLETRTDFDYVRVRSVASVLQAVRRVVEPLDMQARCQVLIPMREGNAGTNEANIVLQAVLNSTPHSEGDPVVTRDRHSIREGDRVIQTKNNYDLQVYNGEIGQVEAITTKEVIVQFPEARAIYQRGRGDDQALELAYALTVHKSQGSEFPWVLCVVHSTHTIMLNRRLFYTAITRAKQGVVLVGDDAGIERALSTGFTKSRLTTLADRIGNTLDPITEPPTSTERTENDAQ